MSGPITPDQVYLSGIPESLFEWVNKAIRDTWDGVRAVVIIGDLNRAAQGMLTHQAPDTLHSAVIAHYSEAGWQTMEDRAGGRLIFMKPPKR